MEPKIKGKSFSETPFPGSNLNFTIRVFTWGLANNHDICERYAKPAKNIILSNLILDIINLK